MTTKLFVGLRSVSCTPSTHAPPPSPPLLPRNEKTAVWAGTMSRSPTNYTELQQRGTLMRGVPRGGRRKKGAKGVTTAGSREGCGGSTPGHRRRRRPGRKTSTRASPRPRPCLTSPPGRPCRRYYWAPGNGGRSRRTRKTGTSCSTTRPPSCVLASQRRYSFACVCVWVCVCVCACVRVRVRLFVVRGQGPLSPRLDGMYQCANSRAVQEPCCVA